MYVNVNGVLRKVSKVHANVNGSIKTVQTGYVNANGTLRKFIVNGVSLLGRGWTSVGSTKIDVNTSTQLEFSGSKSWEDSYGHLSITVERDNISIPAGAQVRLTGTIEFVGSSLSSRLWQVTVWGSSEQTILNQRLYNTATISETLLVPEAATKITLTLGVSSSNYGPGDMSVKADFSEILLLT